VERTGREKERPTDRPRPGKGERRTHSNSDQEKTSIKSRSLRKKTFELAAERGATSLSSSDEAESSLKENYACFRRRRDRKRSVFKGERGKGKGQLSKSSNFAYPRGITGRKGTRLAGRMNSRKKLPCRAAPWRRPRRGAGFRGRDRGGKRRH